jgi:NAD+ synthase (glutamine-hydrolysing)
VSVLRVAGAQLDNLVGDVDGNARQILSAMRWAEEQAADVLVLPELALTGYPPEDLVLRREFVDATRDALAMLARHSGSTTTIVGTLDVVPPRRNWDTKTRTVANSAALLCDGELRGTYHKVLLPTYEIFDEARSFVAGNQPDALWRIGGSTVGVCVCEDLWSGNGPPEAQAAAGAQILLVPNASPYHRGKPEGRRALASSVARRNGVPLVYVNCIGGQDELVFDGGSLIVDSEGELFFRAGEFDQCRFCVDVPLPPPRPANARVGIVHARVAAPRSAEPPPPSAEQPTEAAQVWQALVLGTRDFARKNGLQTAVLGLSGGIDSAVTAAVAADALGPENVLGVNMPAPTSSTSDLFDAERLAVNLGIGFEVIPIGPVMATLNSELTQLFERRLGRDTRSDLQARTRGAILMAISDELGHFALATGNKSELSIGAGALFGDVAGHFTPLKDCPKTLLYTLARYRNSVEMAIPEGSITRTPTAQLTQDGLLPPYEVLDPIVERYIENGEGLEEIVDSGFDPTIVRGVLQMIDDAEFARRQTPPGVKITAQAFGMDRRMPISNAWRPYEREEVEVGG